MTRRLLWKLCFILVMGTIVLFYVLNVLSSQAEEGLSYIALDDQKQIIAWGVEAEKLYLSEDKNALSNWLNELQTQEETWAGVIETNVLKVAGGDAPERIFNGVLLGRDVAWKIHLYFPENPIMEVTFSDNKTRFLIQLPNRMRPGLYFAYASIALRILLPMTLLIPLTLVLYNHIMSPLRQLERATRSFSEGKLNARVSDALGNRNDELTQLANAFDLMASRTSDLITSQRQLISDLSHELRTPLTRLDIAINSLFENKTSEKDIQRVSRESQHIRKLVEDTLTLAWLDNEQNQLHNTRIEDIDLVDLLDVLLSDAQFEFPDRLIEAELPENALIHKSNHRAVGQAIENILRNALRYTPQEKTVSIVLPGVPDKLLNQIFQPFYRVEGPNQSNHGFGLGLALAKRQLASVSAVVSASNMNTSGLRVDIVLPKHSDPAAD